ncbi:MAG: hypothetical protein JNL70_25585 [Saprospiraceae bacterium]|nr:hypothetical protein [Saprospiraceae bacterium]
MKKNRLILWLLMALPTLNFAQNVAQYNTPKWTLEEVKTMVAKYHLEDSITATKNNGLMYADSATIEQWAQNWVKAIGQREERASFFRQTQTVRTREDYYKVLEAHSSVWQATINSHGGRESYEKDKTESLKTDWRIYRNEKGELAFVPKSEPVSKREEKLGQRIDMLPRSKE